MTFYVQAPIFVFREFMRHRIASLQRGVRALPRAAPGVLRPRPRAPAGPDRQAGGLRLRRGHPRADALVAVEATKRACATAYAAYREMLDAGVAREVARGVLPVATYSSMYVTMNARSLMNFLSLRTKRPDSRVPVLPPARDRDGRRADGGALGPADAAHPRRLRGQRPGRRPSRSVRFAHASPSPAAPFGRLLTAMVTPFAPTGRSTSTAPSGSPTHLVDAGNDGLVVNGTTGESPTTTDAEKDAAAARRASRRSATGPRSSPAWARNDTAPHRASSPESAEKAGAHGLLVVTPYYNKPPQAGPGRALHRRRRRHRPAGDALRHPRPQPASPIATETLVAAGRAPADRRGQGRQGRPVRRLLGDGPHAAWPATPATTR